MQEQSYANSWKRRSTFKIQDVLSRFSGSNGLARHQWKTEATSCTFFAITRSGKDSTLGLRTQRYRVHDTPYPLCCQRWKDSYFKERKAKISGLDNLVQIFVFCRKLIALVKWKIFGRNSGRVACIFLMELTIARQFWYL